MTMPPELIIPAIQSLLCLTAAGLSIRLWKESPFAFSALTAMLIYLAATGTNLKGLKYSIISFLPEHFDLPLLLLFFIYFTHHAITRLILPGLFVLLMGIFVTSPERMTLFSLITTSVIAAFLFVKSLKQNIYQDRIAAGKAIILAGTVFYILVNLFLHFLSQSASYDIIKELHWIASAGKIVWLMFLISGLYRIKRGRIEASQKKQSVWKEEPESFQFL